MIQLEKKQAKTESDNSQLSQDQKDKLEKLKIPHSVMSNEESSMDDIEESQYLEKFIATKFDDEASSKEKLEIFNQIQQIIHQWSAEIVSNRQIADKEACKHEAQLLTYGSYHLGVGSKGGDMDLSTVAPHFITKDDFFDNLGEKLKNHKSVKNLQKRRDATVPILTFDFNQYSIDLNIAILDRETVPDDIDKNIPDELLAKIDPCYQKALNGRKTNLMILQSIGPKQGDIFRVALKCVKYWAKNQCISDNMMGYLQGICLAIMVAKICQLFPNYKLNRILQKFFEIYNEWNWENIPLKIEEPQDDSWKDQKGSDPKMIILTPARPYQNCTSKVTQLTFTIIKDMFKRAHNIINKYIISKNKSWESLFERFNFFGQYELFIEIDILSKEDKQFEEWKQTVQYQLLKLQNLILDNLKRQGIENSVRVHFYTEIYPNQDKDFKFCQSQFIGLKRIKQSSDQNLFQDQNTLYLYSAVRQFMQNKILNEKRNGSNVNNIRIYQIKKDQILEFLSRLQKKQTNLLDDTQNYKIEYNNQIPNKAEQFDLIDIDDDIHKKLFDNNKVDHNVFKKYQSDVDTSIADQYF